MRRPAQKPGDLERRAQAAVGISKALGVNLGHAHQRRALERRAAAIEESVGRAHAAQIVHQREDGAIAHRDPIHIGDRQRKARALQQRADIAQIGKRRDTRRHTTLQFGFYTPVCELIAGELAKIGIKVSLKELTFSQWINYYDGPKTYGNLFVNDNEIFADPSAHASAMITSKEFNTSGWTTPALNSLVSEGLATTDNGKRLAIYGDIMKTVANEVPYVPLFVVDYNVALRSGFAITNKFSIVYNFSQPFELYVTRSTT